MRVSTLAKSFSARWGNIKIAWKFNIHPEQVRRELNKALGRFAELFYAKDEKGGILNRRGESVTVPENPQKHAFHTFAPYGGAESITM